MVKAIKENIKIKQEKTQWASSYNMAIVTWIINWNDLANENIDHDFLHGAWITPSAYM